MGSIKGQLICLDTCIVLVAIAQEKPAIANVQPIIDAAENGDCQLVLPTVVIAECLYIDNIKAQSIPKDEQSRFFERFFDRSIFEKVPAHTLLCKKAARLAQTYTLTPFDAVVVQTAISAGCDTLVTTDGEVKKKSRNRTKKHKRLLALDGMIDGAQGKLRIKTPSDVSMQSSLSLR